MGCKYWHGFPSCPEGLRAAIAAPICAAMIASTGAVPAAEVDVLVVDSAGEPVPNVAVYLSSDNRSAASGGTRAVMDQVDTQFVPHILVVQTGTRVEFPNSDTIAHHVYSFSHPNHFKLPIYKGDAHPPVTFEYSGVVILGCNIHDNMLGFILVVDTDRFSKTNQGGMASLQIDDPRGAELSIWSPRIRDAEESLTQILRDGNGAVVEFRLRKNLRPAHDQHSDGMTWSEY